MANHKKTFFLLAIHCDFSDMNILKCLWLIDIIYIAERFKYDETCSFL